MKRTIALIIALLLLLPTVVHATDYNAMLKKASEQERGTAYMETTYGLVSLNLDTNNLYLKDKFIQNFNVISFTGPKDDNKRIALARGGGMDVSKGYDADVIRYTKISDCLYHKPSESIFIVGVGLDTLDRSKPEWRGQMQYIGMNYNYIYRFDLKTKKITNEYILPGSGVYSADYDTNFYEDENHPKEKYVWSVWTVEPMICNSRGDDDIWLLIQMPNNLGEVRQRTALDDQSDADPYFMRIEKIDVILDKNGQYKSTMIYNYMWFTKETFENINEYPYTFNSFGTIIAENQSAAPGYLQIMNTRDEGGVIKGVIAEFDLTVRGKPKLVRKLTKD